MLIYKDNKPVPSFIEWCELMLNKIAGVEGLHTGLKFSRQQKDILLCMGEECARNVIKAPRRSGLTTMMLLDTAYKFVYGINAYNMVFMSDRKASSAENFRTFKKILELCDKPLFVEKLSDNRLLVKRPDGEYSSIMFESSVDNLRGCNLTDIKVDNAGFMDNPKEMLEFFCTYPNPCTSISVSSCPNGKDAFFYQLYQDALIGKNCFRPISLNWYLDDYNKKALYFTNEEGDKIPYKGGGDGIIFEYLQMGYRPMTDERAEREMVLGHIAFENECEGIFYEPSREIK